MTTTASQEQVSSFASLAAEVQLKDVRLVESFARTRVRAAEAVPNAHVRLKYVSRPIERLDSGFLVGAAFTAQVLTGSDEVEDEESIPLEIKVLFALEYAVPDIERFTDAVLQEFSNVNGAFNAWPYWREYVQATVARMNLPPLTLPVFRVRPEPSHETTKSTVSDLQGSRPPSKRKRQRA